MFYIFITLHILFTVPLTIWCIFSNRFPMPKMGLLAVHSLICLALNDLNYIKYGDFLIIFYLFNLFLILNVSVKIINENYKTMFFTYKEYDITLLVSLYLMHLTIFIMAFFP